MMTTVLGAAMLPILLGLAGCSGEETSTTPKADVVKKRDEMQKATQSGIPGKTTDRPGGRPH
jgi:hypothetical protein